MNDNHNPKKIIYKFNISHDEFLVPREFFDADTPFPTVHREDELFINGKRLRVSKVYHTITEAKDHIDWLTVVVASPFGE